MRSRVVILAGVVVVALAVRLVLLGVLLPRLNPAADIDSYRSLGRQLAATGQFACTDPSGRLFPEMNRLPVYPAFLAALIKLGGDRLWLFLVVQCVLGALTCALAALLAARWVSWGVAAVAGLLVAVDPISVMRCADLRDEVVFGLLITAGVCVLVWQRGSAWAWLVGGLLWSLAALCRPGMIGLGALALLAGGLWRVRPRLLVVFLAAYLPLLGCWATRMWRLTGCWTLSTAVTENLLLQRGAAIEAALTGRTVAQVREGYYQQYGDLGVFANPRTVGQALPRWRQAWWRIAARAPGRVARQTVRDALEVLFAPGKLNLAHMMKEPPVPSWWWPVPYSAALVLVFVLAVRGAVTLGRDAVLVTLVVAYLVVFSAGTSRYRTQIAPSLVVLAVAGAECWRRRSLTGAPGQ